MPGDYFWMCVEALSCTLDGDPKTAEENFSVYENHALNFAPEKREHVRRQLVDVIGGLSRLEARLAEHDDEPQPSTRR
jgi:hypothetical protein